MVNIWRWLVFSLLVEDPNIRRPCYLTSRMWSICVDWLWAFLVRCPGPLSRKAVMFSGQTLFPSFFSNDIRELRVISLRRRKRELQGRGQRPILTNPEPPTRMLQREGRETNPKIPHSTKTKRKTIKPANTHNPTQLNTREEDSNLLRPRAPAEHQRIQVMSLNCAFR